VATGAKQEPLFDMVDDNREEILEDKRDWKKYK